MENLDILRDSVPRGNTTIVTEQDIIWMNAGEDEKPYAGSEERKNQAGTDCWACRGEESVTIRIKVAGQELLAMLDTGATPSVIDRRTIDHLGLTEHVVLSQSRVFGLCKRPVEVQGVIQIHVTVGEQHIQTEFQVLDCDESILLLGRKFMSKFGLVSFDWKGGRN